MSLTHRHLPPLSLTRHQSAVTLKPSVTDRHLNLIARHTEYLLLAGQCVVIPGIGAVLAHYNEAKIGEDGTVTPPCRIYTFNGALTLDDGAIEASVQRAQGVSAQTAHALVTDAVADIQRTLKTEGRFDLGRAGTLVLSEDGIIGYSAPPADLLTPLAHWLMPVAPATVKAQQPEQAFAITKKRPSAFRRFARGVAAAAALVAIALTTATPVTVNNTTLASTALPMVKAPRPAYVPSASIPVLKIYAADSICMPVDTAARNRYRRQRMQLQDPGQNNVCTQNVKVAQTHGAGKSADPGFRLDSTDPYCVVVASVRNQAEAKQFIKDATLRYGLKFGCTEANGRVRIYAATAQSPANARAAATLLSQSFDGAWVACL